MNNFIAFFNSFFNYIVLMILFVAAGGIGAAFGIAARKKKNASLEEATTKDNN